MLVTWLKRLEDTGEHWTTKYWNKSWHPLKALEETEDSTNTIPYKLLICTVL